MHQYKVGDTVEFTENYTDYAKVGDRGVISRLLKDEGMVMLDVNGHENVYVLKKRFKPVEKFVSKIVNPATEVTQVVKTPASLKIGIVGNLEVGTPRFEITEEAINLGQSTVRLVIGAKNSSLPYNVAVSAKSARQLAGYLLEIAEYLDQKDKGDN